MNMPRLKLSPRLRALLRYDKLAGPAPRMLILESKYWLDDACRNAARLLGWEVETVPVVQEGRLPREACRWSRSPCASTIDRSAPS